MRPLDTSSSVAIQTRVAITPSEHVTATAYPAAGKRAGICVMLAHGAGTNQSHPFMVRFAGALAARGFDALTFNFLYSEQRRRVPDPNARLELCWRRMIESFHDGSLIEKPGRLVIGGKSMGGRIASQVVAADPAGVAGLLLLGYPLHPPGQPDKPRTRHLPDIRVPMLFVQGERDVFGTPEELAPVIDRLKAPASLFVVEGGDHSLAVRKKAPLSQEQVDKLVLDTIEQWLRDLSS
jgi:predicted alpha/beta-hydrolase family hydrolase